MSRAAVDLYGQRFGRLTVLRRAPTPAGAKDAMWACRCECGAERTVYAGNLRRGTTTSCGCLSRERAGMRKTHGHSVMVSGKPSPEFVVWGALKQRCLNPNHHAYPRYGGRGITVCDRWRNSFENFLLDVGPRPAGMSLDRYPNNDGNYEPGNVRWATRHEQHRNKRNNRLITVGGETLCSSAWAEKAGGDRGIVLDRLRRGWAPELAVLTPPRLFTRWHRPAIPAPLNAPDAMLRAILETGRP